MRIAVTRLGAFGLAVLVALGSQARAEGSVGVIVTGEGSMQPQLEAQIEGWLSEHGHTLVASPLPPEAISALIDCFVAEDQTCARGIVEKRAKSTSMVYARVDTKNNESNGKRDVTLTAYWFDKGHDAVAERKTCRSCTEQSLRTTADEIMRKLVGGGDGHIKLRSTPAGARITIDGQPIGVTPLDWDLPAGKHTVQIDKQGWRAAARNIVVVGDKTDVLALELVRPSADDHGIAWPRIVPLAMMIGGGGLLATGGVMIAIDQDLGPFEPREIRNTGPTGIGLAVGGAVVGVVGAYLLWFGSRRATSTPVAAFYRDAAYVGWSGQF